MAVAGEARLHRSGVTVESSISQAEFAFHSRISFLNFLTLMYLDISSCALSFSRPQRLSSSSAGHQRKQLALCDYMHIDVLFTDKAQMNKVLVQLLLVNM